ncbi:hypothetical protein P6P35_16245, partial [Clostridium perfringens]|nr:hypothetical protein [Clostridium perfringens]
EIIDTKYDKYFNSPEHIQDGEYIMLTSTGKEKVVLKNSNEIVFNNQHVYVECIVDISKVKEIQTALDESERGFKNVLLTAPIGIHFYELNGS